MIRDAINRLKKFQADIPFVIKDIVELNTYEIINSNIDQLYSYGIDNTGKRLIPSYAMQTVMNKLNHGQVASRVTLRDTGAFYDSFIVIATLDSFEVSAVDSKRDDLVRKYGANLFGLTEENQMLFAKEILYPALIYHLHANT